MTSEQSKDAYPSWASSPGNLCLFCFQGLCTLNVTIGRSFDFRGMPAWWTPALRWHQAHGFPMCDTCAGFAITGNAEAMKQRVAPLFVPYSTPWTERLDKHSRYVTARYYQQIYWLGNSEGRGSVQIYENVERAYRVFFDLLNLSNADSFYPSFSNGVELWCSAIGDRCWLEEIRSAVDGKGNARKVLRVAAASADIHEVELHGWVEAHDVNGKRRLSDEQLHEWYGRVGFVSDTEHRNLIHRLPRVASPIEERLRLFKQAGLALKG